MAVIRSSSVLPARRSDVSFQTSDGLRLVGELALPLSGAPVATLLWCHPLPTAGGYMDSHVIRKAANRLPAMANIAVLRFNFRGVSSPRGLSEGSFGEGEQEGLDLDAALRFLDGEGLSSPWLVGWSFGTEVILKHALDSGYPFSGALLLSPPLHRASDADLARWVGRPEPVVALVPEHDDFLQPAEASRRFATIPHARVIAAEGAKHLFVGEKYTHLALSEIVAQVAPEALPLPTEWPEDELEG
ncbi:alpha/beta hydrolase [Pontimonas sp.]|uniref:alpha/beta hydrolase n=1 Tax=Pontimonas sp. TaxID=2304492 RepID=UPI00286FFACA|nr:alpha/beta hydrolase [Pontimonas sp.]MDR9434377.1 alpha/beta hydrolase [Pontimonas sp.]